MDRMRAMVACAVGMAGLTMGQMAHAQFIYTKIADTSTTNPSGGLFTSFSPSGPSISGGNVAFTGFGTGGQIGVYLSSQGTLSTIADLNSSDPSGGAFTNFGAVSMSGNTVAFGGMYNNGSYIYTSQGYYAGSGGALTTLVDINSVAPGTTNKLTNFGGVLAGNQFAFTAAVGGVNSVYGSQNGNISLLADKNTPDPSGGGFSALNNVFENQNGAIVFNGHSSVNSTSGIYEKSGNTVTTIADTTTADPSGLTFGGFSSGQFAGDSNIVFYGIDKNFNNRGIYEEIGNGLVLIADSNTPDPSGGTFGGGFGGYAGSWAGVAFHGYSSLTGDGIYTNLGGTILPVAVTGTMLDGKRISSVNMSTTGMDGYDIAFQVKFSDRTQAIYMAQYVPEPGPIAMFIVGGTTLLSGTILRRKKK